MRPRALALGLAGALLMAACGGNPVAPPGPGSDQAASTAGTTLPSPAAPHGLIAPQPATSATDLADRLVAAEGTVRDTRATRESRAQAAFETQVLYRQIARTPAWQRAVLDRAGTLRPTVADHLTARRNLRSVLTMLSSELPAWRIVRPAPVEELLAFYEEGERRYGVAWEVLAAVNLVETGFGKIRGYSTAGARGPMQFIPSTWAAYGEGDIDDPHDAIMAAARYLQAAGGDREAGIDRALHAYNHHDGYVRGVRAYARILERDPGALAGLHGWQIIYLSTSGDVWLPIGWSSADPVPVARYVRRHPDRLLGSSTS